MGGGRGPVKEGASCRSSGQRLCCREPMRIALDVRPLQNASAGRGVGRYVRSLIANLPAGADEYLLLESRWHRPGAIEERPDARRVELLRPPRAITVFDQAATPLLCAAKKIDVFHSTFYALPRLASRKAAWILTVHDLIPLMIPGAVSGKNTAIFAQIYRSSLGADAVIVPSRRTAEALASRMNVPTSRIRIVPMGVGPPFLAAGAPGPSEGARTFDALSAGTLGPTGAAGFASPDAERSKASAPPTLVYNGGFDATKNVPFLIDALAELGPKAGARLCLVGEPGAARAALQERAERRGVAPRVVFLGRLDDAELARLYARADVFVSASRAEGFGLPPLEAMACGCPVVALTSGAVPEVLEGAALGVDGLDPVRFAEAVRSVLEDRDLARRLASQGRARAESLTWERTARATYALYREMAGPRA